MNDNFKKGFEGVLEAIPHTLKILHDEANDIGKTLVMSQLKTHDIVSRDEFNTQKQILAELADKVSKLELLIENNSRNYGD